MELKEFQKTAISRLDHYLAFWNNLGDPAKAYNSYWEEQGVHVGMGDIRPYNDEIAGVPHICFKIPTGGGKTFLAANSIRTILNHLPAAHKKIVVWLVPSDIILLQTYKNLSNPDHPYRQAIDSQWNSHVEVYSKDQLLNAQNFNVTTVLEQLSVFVLSYDTFRSATQDNRKVFEDNANLTQFVPTYEHPESLIPGVPSDALAQVINQFNPVVIVDESHNATSELSLKMLKQLNPCCVLDLTATPRQNSNIIDFVTATELKAENMVKLPVIAINRDSVEEVFLDAIVMRERLEQQAKVAFETTKQYIRPIALFQAQPKTEEDTVTFDKIKQKLIDVGIPEEQIKIKTSKKNELKDIDLANPTCPVRYIITVNALKEGWDCPFAYILASVANKTSAVDVEQIVGRVLRLPYTSVQPTPYLNSCFVFSSSIDFQKTVQSIVSGLNSAGFTSNDYRVVEQESVLPSSPALVQGTLETEEGDPLSFDPQPVSSAIQASQSENSQSAPSGSVNQILQKASDVIGKYEAAVSKSQTSGLSVPPEVGSAMKISSIKDEFASAKQLTIPKFCYRSASDIITEESYELLKKEDLETQFNLSLCPYPDKGQLLEESDEAWSIDVTSTSGGNPEINRLSQEKVAIFKEMLSRVPEAGRQGACRHLILSIVGSIPSVSSKDLKTYIDHILGSMNEDELIAFQNEAPLVGTKIKNYIEQVLLPAERLKRFKERIQVNSIVVQPLYKLPLQIAPIKPTSMLGKSLYTAEEDDMNPSEFDLIGKVASLSNVVWWHRIRDSRNEEFSLNGFINHYPDFMVYTAVGNIVLVEFKGTQLANPDSANKVYLGTTWASLAGPKYKYFMVFSAESSPIPGAVTVDQLLQYLKQL